MSAMRLQLHSFFGRMHPLVAAGAVRTRERTTVD